MSNIVITNLEPLKVEHPELSELSELELNDVTGGIGVVTGVLIVAGVIFVAGVITGASGRGCDC